MRDHLILKAYSKSTIKTYLNEMHQFLYRLGNIPADDLQPETSQEKSKYNIFHKLVFNIKRMLNALPFGKTTIASYLAALYLIKEKTGLSDRALAKILREATGVDPRALPLNESQWYLEEGRLRAGNYTLVHDIQLPASGETLALKHSTVVVKESCESCGKIFGAPVYIAYHPKTRQEILITQHDIKQ